MNGAMTSSVPRRLLILRHAKSSWADEYADDWERPLTDRGVRDATRVGELLRRLALVPDLIITSDAVRAETTARLAADAAGYGGRVTQSSELYHAKPDTVIGVAAAISDLAARTVMIVGHNPGLEELVAQLTGEAVDLPTATLVHLELPVKQWPDIDRSTGAALIGIWRPGDM